MTQYSLTDQILLVGEGDFSFSVSLAFALGSGINIVATSLDTEDLVKAKYAKGGSNLKTLEMMGATLLHGIDATKMSAHAELKMRKFNRIVYNFPHAGFHGKEDDPQLIDLHRKLVQGFFDNAKHMLCRYGEVHVTHKTDYPYCEWNIKELASKHSLRFIGSPKFNIEDYPGYSNKRGAGTRCDEQFTLGECCTFMFVIGDVRKRKPLEEIPNMCSSFSDRNVYPRALRYPQNAFLSSLESFARTLYANDYSFSERINPHPRYYLGVYIPEPRKKFKGVQETYRNCRSDRLQIREPEERISSSRAFEGFPATFSAENACETYWESRSFKGFPGTSFAENAMGLTQGTEVLHFSKDFQLRMPVRLTQEAEVLLPCGEMLGRGGYRY